MTEIDEGQMTIDELIKQLQEIKQRIEQRERQVNTARNGKPKRVQSRFSRRVCVYNRNGYNGTKILKVVWDGVHTVSAVEIHIDAEVKQ